MSAPEQSSSQPFRVDGVLLNPRAIFGELADRPRPPKDTAVGNRQYGEKRVYIFDDHATALKPWAITRQTVGSPLYLLTFDYHTDTHPAFFHQAYFAASHEDTRWELQNQWLAETDPADLASIESAVQRSKHDEHIAVAVGAGILAAALVVSINGAGPTHSLEYLANRQYGSIPPRPHHYELPDPLIFHLDTQWELQNNPEWAIGSRFLNKVLREADDMMAAMGHGPLLDADYLLDIDLDYFTSPVSLEPKQSGTFYRLLRNARAITIAREPRCVSSCSNYTMTAENSLARLEQHLEKALGARRI